MGAGLRDVSHLIRMAGLLAALLLLFVLVRAIAVPDRFGEYGHFRSTAIDDNANLIQVFAGHQACADCHDDILELRRGSKHEQIRCEACHGPLAGHAADPGSAPLQLPDGRESCAGCHAREGARPDWFPQIVVEEHAGEAECTDCHSPHHPEIEGS